MSRIFANRLFSSFPQHERFEQRKKAGIPRPDISGCYSRIHGD